MANKTEKIKIAASKSFIKQAAEKYKQASDDLLYEYLPSTLYVLKGKISKSLKVWLEYHSSVGVWATQKVNEISRYYIGVEYMGHIESRIALQNVPTENADSLLDFVKQFHALKGVGYTWEDWEKHFPLSNFILDRFPELERTTTRYFIDILAKRSNMYVGEVIKEGGRIKEWTFVSKDTTTPRKLNTPFIIHTYLSEEAQCYALAGTPNPFQEFSPVYRNGTEGLPDYDRFLLDLRRQIVQLGKWESK